MVMLDAGDQERPHPGVAQETGNRLQTLAELWPETSDREAQTSPEVWLKADDRGAQTSVEVGPESENIGAQTMSRGWARAGSNRETQTSPEEGP